MSHCSLGMAVLCCLLVPPCDIDCETWVCEGGKFQGEVSSSGQPDAFRLSTHPVMEQQTPPATPPSGAYVLHFDPAVFKSPPPPPSPPFSPDQTPPNGRRRRHSSAAAAVVSRSLDYSNLDDKPSSRGDKGKQRDDLADEPLLACVWRCSFASSCERLATDRRPFAYSWHVTQSQYK